MAKAVLLDVDGTLIDSVDLHAQAWKDALARFGKDVPYEAVRAQIGKGGDQLLPEFLSEDELASFGQELIDHRADLYRRQFLPWAQPFPHARELLVRLKQARVLVALATSSHRRELAHYLRLLDGASVVDAVTTADDVDASKPAPDVFEAALRKLRVRARQAIAVGDSPFDVQAAAGAGLAAVGVLSGGFPEHDLRSAGCVAVFQDVGELTQRLGQEPMVLEPAPAPRDR